MQTALVLPLNTALVSAEVNCLEIKVVASIIGMKVVLHVGGKAWKWWFYILNPTSYCFSYYVTDHVFNFLEFYVISYVV